MVLRELQVDMNLSINESFAKGPNRSKNDDFDVPLVRGKKSSASLHKRRRRYAILDDEDEEDDESSNVGGSPAFEIELPSCDDSSSEEEQDDDSMRDDEHDEQGWGSEWGIGKAVARQEFCLDSQVERGALESVEEKDPSGEEDLLEAAFFAPMPFRDDGDDDQHHGIDFEAEQGTSVAATCRASDKAYDPPPMQGRQLDVDQQRFDGKDGAIHNGAVALTESQQPASQPEIVDLCDDDDDDDDKGDDGASERRQQPAQRKNEVCHPFFAPRRGGTSNTRQGVRTQSKSPRFNANSRAACLQRQPLISTWDHDVASHPTSPARVPSLPAHRHHSQVTAALTNDDIVDSWSDEETRTARANPRRVTNVSDYPRPQAPSFSGKLFAAARPTLYSTAAGASTSDPYVPAASRATHSQSFQQQPGHNPRRRRVRDATASNAARAGSVVVSRAKTLSTAVATTAPPSSFLQTSQNLWYRTHASQPSMAAEYRNQQPLRNDLIGGSGVGAGNYTMYTHENSDGEPPTAAVARPTTAASSSRGRSKRTSNSNTKKRKAAGAKKKAWGGGRKNNYRKKDGGGGNKKQTSRRRRTSSNPDYSRQDADLKHVGGANIIF